MTMTEGRPGKGGVSPPTLTRRLDCRRPAVRQKWNSRVFCREIFFPLTEPTLQYRKNKKQFGTGSFLAVPTTDDREKSNIA